MFARLDEREKESTFVNHLFRMVMQEVLSALLAWFVWIAFDSLGLDVIHRSSLFGINVQLIIPATISAVGLIAGSFIGAKWAQMRPSALWQWAAPLGLLFAAMGYDANLFGLSSLWGGYFIWKRPGIDEPPITIYLLTYPTISALSYSLGALISKRLRRSGAGDVSQQTRSESREAI